MKKNPMGRTGLEVTELCLGSMTWGTQNTEAEGHAQIDMALDHGINFIDTAEAYPVNPMSRELSGRTEEIIGNWLAKTGRRDEVILATKIAGSGNVVRDGAEISPETIDIAIEGSLKRLQTDVIDLYQLHWPNRGGYMFRRNWNFAPEKQDKAGTLTHMEDVLAKLQDHVDKGTIRYIGLSNESAWGTAKWLEIAEKGGFPRMATIQNEYSLMYRLYDTDLAELSHHEDVGLLSYSPLACGLLTGKYRGGVVPKGSRYDIMNRQSDRHTTRAYAAIEAYAAIAEKHGLNLTQMCLAWCCTRPFMCSNIFGATSTDQLAEILGTVDVTLSDEVMADIDQAHRAHPMPF